jgi:hypothetical protein
MTITQRTVEEAGKYILDSIEDWKNTGQDKKIISLSNWAEKWRSNTGGYVSRMRDLQKNIRALEQIMKRKKKLNQQTDLSGLEKELKAHQENFKFYVEKFGDLKPKKTNKKLDKGITLE